MPDKLLIAKQFNNFKQSFRKPFKRNDKVKQSAKKICKNASDDVELINENNGELLD